MQKYVTREKRTTYGESVQCGAHYEMKQIILYTLDNKSYH